MTLKSKILSALEGRREEYQSGQQLADEFLVSRAAVWKAVQQLEREGHEIDAVSNLGYRLKQKSDVLSAEGIGAALGADGLDVVIEVMDEVDSTNNEIKRRQLSGTVAVFAEAQTSGRGRRGKSFYSPKGQSIYVSFNLQPSKIKINIKNVTTAAAVAVRRAIWNYSGKDAQIKWVNDLFYEGKKICGILTEAMTSVESGEIESVVLGIGVNCRLNLAALPKDLQDIVGSLDLELPRNGLAAEMVREVLSEVYKTPWSETLDAARRHSCVIGKPITYGLTGVENEGVAVGLDADGGLMVEMADGAVVTLESGLISLKVK